MPKQQVLYVKEFPGPPFIQIYDMYDKAAIPFPTNAETPEAAAPYNNLHLQTKLEHVLDLVG